MGVKVSEMGSSLGLGMLLIFISLARRSPCSSRPTHSSSAKVSSKSIRQEQPLAWSARLVLIRIPTNLGLYEDLEECSGSRSLPRC
ncbi:hypothetical protein BDR22DRAFT_869902 [Usnea florida]